MCVIKKDDRFVKATESCNLSPVYNSNFIFSHTPFRPLSIRFSPFGGLTCGSRRGKRPGCPCVYTIGCADMLVPPVIFREGDAEEGDLLRPLDIASRGRGSRPPRSPGRPSSSRWSTSPPRSPTLPRTPARPPRSRRTRRRAHACSLPPRRARARAPKPFKRWRHPPRL